MIENKILVVDDEEPIRQLLKTAFESEGYKLVTAGTGEEALRILKKENIQVMFIDLKLPGIDGLELCRRIRKDHPIACIHAVTGYASLFELADSREAGFDDYFIKPVKIDILINAARNAFEKLNRWKKRNEE